MVPFNERVHISFSSPWWTPELTRCKNILSFHFNKWRENNFSKDENCVAFNRYQIPRKNFRRAVKEAQNKKLYQKYVNIESLKNTDSKKFWKNFKNIKKDTSPRLFTVNKKQDKTSITEEFAQHFEHLLNTPKITPLKERNIRPIPPFSTQISNAVTKEHMFEAISNLKLNKSCDSFYITAEHLKYSKCDQLIGWLTNFFNSIFQSGYVPYSLSSSMIIPLVKS